MAEVAEGLSVDPAHMRSNIESTGGVVFAERAVVMLAPELGPEAARRKVEEAIRDTGAPPDLPGLRTPEDYLGSAEVFRRRLMQGEK
jgi:3-carboxy-cis,cis-muconate cycloisomerase